MSTAPEIDPLLTDLQRRVTTLEAELTRARVGAARRRRALVATALIAAFSAAGTVAAASGACPNSMPVCFLPDTPARAAEVNQNFMQLKEWLEAKVGAVAVGTPGTVSVSTSSLSATGAVTGASLSASGGSISGANASGNLFIETTGTNTYLNWGRGTGAVIFGTGASAEAGRVAANGNATFNALTQSGTGGNTPHACVVRSTTSSYNAACAAGEIAVGGGGRCASLWRLVESLPWGGPLDTDGISPGQTPRAWRSVCQIWGDNGAYAFPQFGAWAVCCKL